MENLDKIYQGKKVLITGGLGFIGSNLAHRLVEFGSQVEIVDALISDYGGNTFNIEGIKDKVNVTIADIRDKSKMDGLVQGKDFIFNLAGTLSHIDSMKDPFTDLEINCRSQLSILESLRQYNPDCKIVFAGTRGQFGKAQYLPVDEKHPLIPTDVNGINNLAGELYHILYNNIYGIRAVSLRLTNTYGPRHQMKHYRQGIINWFMRQIIEGTEIKIYGDGSQVRDLNYVDDVVEALLLVMVREEANGEAYNLGGLPLSLCDIVKKMIEVKGKGSFKLVTYPSETKKIEIGNYVADYSKIKNKFGWQPTVNIDEGLKRTFDFYERHRKNYW